MSLLRSLIINVKVKFVLECFGGKSIQYQRSLYKKLENRNRDKEIKKKIPQVKCPCSHSVEESVVFAHDRLKLWKSDFWTSEVLPHYSFFVFIGEITDFNVIAHFYSLIISALYIFQSIIWSDHIITSLDRSKSQIRRLERVVTSLRSRVFLARND